MKSIKAYQRKCLLVVCHALFLTALTVFLQNKSIVQPEEMAFFKFFSLFKNDILNKDEKPLLDSIVFLDVSKDLALVDDTSFESYSGRNGLDGAKILITDRKKLAVLFSELVKHEGEYKYAICDIDLTDPSPDDSILRPQIEKAKHVIFPCNFISDNLQSHIFNIPTGPVTYQVNENAFVKLPLFYNDSLKSLPVLMTEALCTKRFRRKHGLTFENGRIAFNTVLPNFYYRDIDLTSSGTAKHANLFFLGDLIGIPGFFESYLASKYIVIGNFSTDLHNTYLGETPGPLVLLDTFLTLKEKTVSISFVWLFLLFLFYTAISYKIFIHPKLKFEDLQNRIHVKFLQGFVRKYVSYTGLFILLNMVSYFFFRNFVSLLLVGTYLTLLEESKEKVETFKRSKNVFSFLKEELI